MGSAADSSMASASAANSLAIWGAEAAVVKESAESAAISMENPCSDAAPQPIMASAVSKRKKGNKILRIEAE